MHYSNTSTFDADSCFVFSRKPGFNFGACLGGVREISYVVEFPGNFLEMSIWFGGASRQNDIVTR